MKVVFVCTGNAFTPSMLYKENYFIKASVQQGYETLVLATEYTYHDGKKEKTQEVDSSIDGYILKRLPYQSVMGNEYITEKIRNAKSLSDQIISFAPSFIFYNCPQIYNIVELKRIKEALPKVKIVLDFSTKYINSARNPLSRYILHRLLYRSWLRKAQPYVDCITYVSPETLDFILREYRMDPKLMKEVGLPAEVIPKETREKNRKEIREEYHLSDNQLLFVHSGKIGRLKRTIELLRCFAKHDDSSYKLIIAGSLEDEVKEEIEKLIHQDNRITYIGFVTGAYLTKLLCACDLYLQPGTISQTSQTAICCGSPIMFMRCPTNEELFNGNGFLIDRIEEMDTVFTEIDSNPKQLEEMKNLSMKIANETLEYNKLFQDTLRYAGIHE